MEFWATSSKSGGLPSGCGGLIEVPSVTARRALGHRIEASPIVLCVPLHVGRVRGHDELHGGHIELRQMSGHRALTIAGLVQSNHESCIYCHRSCIRIWCPLRKLDRCRNGVAQYCKTQKGGPPSHHLDNTNSKLASVEHSQWGLDFVNPTSVDNEAGGVVVGVLRSPCFLTGVDPEINSIFFPLQRSIRSSSAFGFSEHYM